ncbi:hypothetical protein B5P22_31190 [Pseudomonas tolaasii]|nr:hypothetical protein [Pseudomonas tolaasii]ARB31573.1 hypothetical protein B5P22_31190 [Pseudomonas tolaasii]
MNFLTFNTMRVMGVPAEDMGLYFKGGGSQKQSSTTVSTPHQQGNFDKLLGGADSWLQNGGYDKNFGGSADFNPVAGQTDAQKAGLGGMTNLGGNLQGLLNGAGIDSLADYLGPYDPNKTGLNSAINAANEQSTWDFDTMVRPELRSGASNAGQYGSSRAGIAEGIATSRLLQQQGNNANTMAFQDQQNYNNNRMNALNNMSNIAKGLGSGNAMQYESGSLQQQQNQNEINGALQKWAYENNASLNDLLAYQQLISGDMGGVNTSNSKSSGGASGGGAGAGIGSIAGGIAGSFFGPMGTMAGSYLGGQLGGAVSK